jgi:putative ABC transport system ATP-binding protein
MTLFFSQVSFVKEKKKLLSNVSFNAEGGDFIVVLGQNGSGKSSLFNLISGSYTPSQGKIYFFEKEITMERIESRSRYIKILFQQPSQNCIDDLTVVENFALYFLNQRVPLPQKIVNSSVIAKVKKILLEASLTEDLLFKKMKDLSGGQKQIICFLMVISTAPDILLLDEATSALDVDSATYIIKKSLAYAREKKKIVFFISHDVSLAQHIGNKVFFIKKGKLIDIFVKSKHNSFLLKNLSDFDYESLSEY